MIESNPTEPWMIIWNAEAQIILWQTKYKTLNILIIKNTFEDKTQLPVFVDILEKI